MTTRDRSRTMVLSRGTEGSGSNEKRDTEKRVTQKKKRLFPYLARTELKGVGGGRVPFCTW